MIAISAVVLAGLVGWLGTPALAAPVQINPGAYTYPDSVDGAAPVSVATTVDLAPGSSWGPRSTSPGSARAPSPSRSTTRAR